MTPTHPAIVLLVRVVRLSDVGRVRLPVAQGLMKAVSSLPELTERKRVIDKHTNIATALLNQIKARSGAEATLPAGSGVWLRLVCCATGAARAPRHQTEERDVMPVLPFSVYRRALWTATMCSRRSY